MKKAAVILLITGILITAFGVYAMINELAVDGVIALLFISGFIAMNGGISFFFIGQEKSRRKKSIVILSIIALFILFAGLFSRYFHQPGAAIEILEGTFLIAFGVGPLVIKGRYDKWREFSVSPIQTFFLSMTDWLSGIFLTLGAAFKLMHWPIATFLIVVGSILFLAAILLWNNVFKRQIALRKITEEKLNKAFEELSDKHDIIENKNKEILDSIHYAKRIQRSLLPTEKYIDKNFKKLRKD